MNVFLDTCLMQCLTALSALSIRPEEKISSQIKTIKQRPPDIKQIILAIMNVRCTAAHLLQVSTLQGSAAIDFRGGYCFNFIFVHSRFCHISAAYKPLIPYLR